MIHFCVQAIFLKLLHSASSKGYFDIKYYVIEITGEQWFCACSLILLVYYLIGIF